MEYRKSAHAVTSLNYHFVFVTKYRKPVLTGEVAEYLKKDIIRLMKGREAEVLEIETDKDHVHILAELSPKYSIKDMVAMLKGITARNLRREFPGELAKYYWKKVFWASSYFVATTGGASLDTIKKYVENQGK